MATSPHSIEKRRQARRFTLSRLGLLHIASSRELCQVRNISPAGLMVRVYRKVAPGDSVKLELKANELLSGSVLWANDWDIGIGFAEPIDVDSVLAGRWLTETGERSRLPRRKVDCPLRLRAGSKHFEGRLCDISQNGAKVELRKPLAEDESVTLTLPDLPPLNAIARWANGLSIGVSFVERLPAEVFARWIEGRAARTRKRATVRKAASPAPRRVARSLEICG